MTERQYVERSGLGRRKNPQDDGDKCVWCDIRWSQEAEKWMSHSEETKDHRQLVCQKIAETKKGIEDAEKKIEDVLKSHINFVPRWMFLLVFGASLTIAGTGFKHMIDTINVGHSETVQKIEIVQRRITETDNSREALKDKLTDLQWSINALTNRLYNVEQRIDKNK